MKLLKFVLLVPWLFACAGQSRAVDLNCDEAFTTIEINRCALQDLKQSEIELQRYYERVVALKKDDETFIESIHQSHSQWWAYREGHCDSVYDYWRDGSIRVVMSLACKTQLTQERTLQLWQSFLTFVDGSEPVLPKPEYFLEHE